MRPNNLPSAVDVPGSQDIELIASADQVFRASAQLVATGLAVNGSIEIYASNDAVFYPNVPTNWALIGSTISLSGPGTYLVPAVDISYQWIKAQYYSGNPGEQTITTIADQTGIPQTEDVTCVADVAGSLNSTYFLLHNAHDVTTYYVWYNVSGGGVDPAVPGATGIQVAITTGDSASDIATASTGPIAAVGGGLVFNANASGDDILIYNLVNGPCTGCSDGTAATGFSFAIARPGLDPGAVSLNSTYFLISDEYTSNEYYAWIDVSGLGVDPLVPGRTGIQIAINAGDSADNVATAVATALNGYFVSSASTNIVSVIMNGTGPFVPAYDSVAAPTGFTFAVDTTNTGVININLKTLGQ